MSKHTEAVPPRRGKETSIALATVAVLLLGAALLWHDLGTREVLGRDENATIIKLDQPDLGAVLHASGLKANGQPSSMQPLYFLLQHLVWPTVNNNAFLLRFLPSVFALLSIVFTFKLGEALWGSEVGWVGALLVAVLPLHVEYGQIIRPYTLLALLSLASAYFLVQGLRTGRPVHWIAFVLTAALNIYTHFNALFVLAAQGVFTAVIWLTALTRLVKGRQHAVALISKGWLHRMALPAASFALVGLLCIPAAQRLLTLRWIGPESGQAAGEITVQLTASFFYRYLYKIGLTSAWLRGLILGLMGLGLAATLYRRRWQAALFSVLWLAIPFLALAAIKSPRPFAERYVIFVPPVALLLAGQGVVAVGHGVAWLSRRRPRYPIRWATMLGLSAVLALLFLPPLRWNYASNRDSHRLDLTIDVLEEFALPGDAVVVSPRFFVQSLEVDGAEVHYLTEHPSAAEMDELAARYERIWILYTSYIPPAELQEPLDRWVQAQGDEFALVRIKASTTLAYRNRGLADDEARLLDRAELLRAMAEVSADEKEAWLRYHTLADTYQSLSELYGSRGESELAADYAQQADEARNTVPDS